MRETQFCHFCGRAITRSLIIHQLLVDGFCFIRTIFVESIAIY
nr:MAG TPA: NADH-PPase NADH pyrophosphatase zinc ribbon domain [Caudoviricetes sp.]